MRHYELVAILSPMLNQDEATSTWADIKSFIGDRDGEITAEQIWGTRRLAYPIRKGSFNFLEGAYYLSSFAVENAFNKELETYLRLDERVLRSLVIRCDGPLEDRPAPGQLTAPSRYIPPGRGRRPDGGGPIPEVPGGSPDRRPEPAFAPPVAASPAVAEPAADPDAPAGPSAEPASAPPVAASPLVAPEGMAPLSAEPASAPPVAASPLVAPEGMAPLSAEPASAPPVAASPLVAPEGMAPLSAEPTADAGAEPPAAPDAPAPPSADAGAEPTTAVTPEPAPVVDTDPAPAPQPEAVVETPPDAVDNAAEPPSSEPAAESDTDAQA